jgi:uncharacterized protein YjbI with pentapeptide repeats
VNSDTQCNPGCPAEAAKPDSCSAERPPPDDLQLIREDIAALKHDVVGIEHRLVQVVRNAYWAATQREGWTPAKRLEAGAALIRYVFAGRTVLALSIGLGGLLALHASFMLADQNRKLDLQNHLSVVSAELAEAQRNAQFAQLIPGIIEDIQKIPSRPDTPASLAATAGTHLRIAVLTQTFQPYRWVEQTVDAAKISEPVGHGAAFDLVQVIRHAYTVMFGSSPFEVPGSGLPSMSVPVLTQRRYSPERGLILVNLRALRFDIRSLTRYNVTFDRAFAPGARLDDIRLDGMVGPDLSKPVNLQFAYLRGATFNRAELGSVVFAETDLKNAELNGIFAADADWSSANLSDAQLKGAYLSRGTFNRTDLSRAVLDGANLAHAQLSTAIGLTAEQLRKSCVSPSTTRLPVTIVLGDYRIDDDCCKRWQNLAVSFRRDSNGVCRDVEQQ